MRSNPGKDQLAVILWMADPPPSLGRQSESENHHCKHQLQLTYPLSSNNTNHFANKVDYVDVKTITKGA